MTEILTESFCERCGTRYTFESTRPRVRLKGVRVLSRGLKNFVLSDDTSIDEAMAAARNEADRETTAHQLDAFHKTFNFCLSCRQYTCPNCWNGPEARCLSCAPSAVQEAPAEIGSLGVLREGILVSEPAPGNGTEVEEPIAWQEPGNWPNVTEVASGAESTDATSAATAVEPEAAVEPIADGQPDFDSTGAVFEVEAVAWVAAEPAVEPIAAAEAAEPNVEAVTSLEAAEERAVEPIQPAHAAKQTPDASDTAMKAAAQTAGLLRRFRPGENLDAALDAYERERSDVRTTDEGLARPEAPEVESEATVVAPGEPVPATVARAEEPAPLEAAGSAPETVRLAARPEPIAAAAPPEEPPIESSPGTSPAPVTEPSTAAAGADVVEQPTWLITGQDANSPRIPQAEPDRAAPIQANATWSELSASEPRWPASPQWPGAAAPTGLPFLGRPVAPQGGIEALWAASNQELVATPPVPGRPNNGIQPCVSCGLSLSGTARFCRRCGTLQER